MRIGIDARNLLTPNNGIGRYLLGACEVLCSRGHEIFLFLPSALGGEVKWSRAQFREGRSKTALCRILWGEFELGKVAAQERLDVFWGPAHRLPEIRDHNVPRVLTIHDLVCYEHPATMPVFRRLADRFLMPLAWDRADAIVCVSHATEHALKSLRPEMEGKIFTCYPGVRQTVCAPSAPGSVLSGITSGVPYALFVGTVEPRKNLEKMLAAYATLAPALRQSMKLVIAGGVGWGKHDLRKQIGQLGLTKDVVPAGFVSDDMLAQLYRHARFLTFPSLYEGFGFPIVEANSYGIPVMTSNTSSMPEVGGNAALLVDPNSVESIASGFTQLAFDEAIHQRLSAAAKSNAARFSWAAFAERMETIFHDVISRGRLP